MPDPANRFERLPEKHCEPVGCAGMAGGTAAVRKTQALPGRACPNGGEHRMTGQSRNDRFLTIAYVARTADEARDPYDR